MLGNWRISSSLLKLEEEIRGRNEKEIYWLYCREFS
jgi:hypothetical protein